MFTYLVLLVLFEISEKKKGFETSFVPDVYV